jgi:hypothetical protein
MADMMAHSAFIEAEFFLLVASSLVIPIFIYWYLLRRTSVASAVVLRFGCLMIALSGIDIYLLQRLKALSMLSRSLADDGVFVSEFSVALYLLPVVFAGLGVNMVSHVLIEHLKKAEQRFDEGKDDGSHPSLK